MKKLILISAFSISAFQLFAAVYPFVYYGLNSDGSPLTNKITISGSVTAPIVGVGSNIVVSFARDYYPDTNGYASNSLAPGNYRLYVEGVSHSVTFGFVSNSAPQNLAQVAGIPVAAFLNFTLAQFSDAGSAAYMPSNNWPVNTKAGIIAAFGATPATNTYAMIVASLGYQPATNGIYIGIAVGEGSGLTNLNASALVGTVPDARLSTNVALMTAGEVHFTGSLYAAGFNGDLIGALWDINGSSGESGQVPVGTGGSDWYWTNTFTGTFTGNGGALTNLNVSKLTGIPQFTGTNGVPTNAVTPWGWVPISTNGTKVLFVPAYQ